MKGGERHPTPETALRRVLTKSDKRKTAKAVIPLRFKESLFLFCRDLASTFEVQSPHVLTRIFLTGYLPILGRVYVDISYCLQAIKIPPNFKRRSRRVFRAWQISSPIHRFFIRWACPAYVKRKEPTNGDFSLVHRLCVLCVWLFDDCYL